jgi:alpha-beta hydrolase superfamily lysophospholipase
MQTNTTMNSEAEAKRFAWTLWSFLKWTTFLLIAVFVLVNTYFCIYQDTYVMERDDLPTGYEERSDLKPVFNGFVAPPGKILPDSTNDWPPVEAAINFQKFESLAQPAKGTLLYLHGNRGSMEQCRWEIEPFLRTGYHVWTMDYRGFGESEGTVSENRLLGDAKLVYEAILETEKIDVIWGRSFGSGIATYLATIESPKRLVLESPYWSLPDAARHTHPYLLPFLFHYRLPSNEFLEYVQCPVHIIHGTDDEKIYFDSSTKLDELGRQLRINGKLHIISGGKHNFRPAKNQPMQTDAAFETVLMECLDLHSEVQR